MSPEGDWRALITDFFAQDVRFYDLREPLRRRWRRWVREAAQVRPGEEVLDACTGTGAMALEFARAGARVTAVDLSPHMLARARAKDREGRVRFLPADVCCLPFPDRSFAVSSLMMALHCMPLEARRAALSELARVTRRRVVIFEPAAGTPWARRLQQAVARVVRMPPYWEEFLQCDLVRLVQESGLEVEEDQLREGGFYRLLVCRPAP